MNIKVSIKSVYGSDKIYPLCDNGKLFAEIAGTKTLTRDTISLVKRLGYSIQVIQPSLGV